MNNNLFRIICIVTYHYLFYNLKNYKIRVIMSNLKIEVHSYLDNYLKLKKAYDILEDELQLSYRSDADSTSLENKLDTLFAEINELVSTIRELASQNKEEEWDEIISSHEIKKLISGFNHKTATSKTDY